METYLTPEQVATRLNVSTRTVYRWLADDKIPGVVALPGRLIRISSLELEHWLKHQQGTAGPHRVPQPMSQRHK